MKRAVLLALSLVAGACSAPVTQPQTVVVAAPVDAGPADLGPIDAEVVATKTPTRAIERVLILGDSMAATDFGKALQKKLARASDLKVARKGKSASGLARPDFFDWFKEAQKQIDKHNPDLVIVIIGGNDGQDLLDERGKGRIVWKSSRWNDRYQARVRDFSELLAGASRRLVWLELPMMDHKSLEKKLFIIRGLQQEVIHEQEGATWLDTRSLLLSSKGKLVRRIRRRRLRQNDGIHFSLWGSRYFANGVYELLQEPLRNGVPSVPDVQSE